MFGTNFNGQFLDNNNNIYLTNITNCSEIFDTGDFGS